MSTECDARLCRCGPLCQNRRFQLHQDALVFPTKEGGKGWGLTAGEFISEGTFIIQYIGEVLSIHSEEGRRRIQEYSKSNCTYMMKLQKDEVIDPTYKGNMARFINHSCEPNCETQKWNVQGEVCVGIFSIKDIQEGEELTFDYKFEAYKTPFTRCLCGAKKCKGYLGLVPSDYTIEEWDERVESMPCEICGSKVEVEGNALILCDMCNNGFHIGCLSPPLSKVPEGAFFCKECLEQKEEQKNKKEVEEIEGPSISDLRKVLEREGKIKSGGGFYIEQRKRPGRPSKRNFELDEEDYDDLKVYNEFFEIQKNFQIELISEMNEELKCEIKKIYEDSEEEDLDDLTTADEKMDTNDETVKNKTNFEKIIDKIAEVFKPIFEEKIKKQLRSRELISNINSDTFHTRRSLIVSKIEISLFKKLLFQEIIKRLRVKLFWNNTIFYSGDIFKKNNEFQINSNDQQYEFIREIFHLMDLAIIDYKKSCGFTSAILKIPAIYLKRVVGEYQKNVHYINTTYQVRMIYDKRFITDECYPLHFTTDITLKGIKENIIQSCQYLQDIIKGLYVERIYMGSSDIKIIISNLMPIKQQIHPAEVRCCRDNALRDINHPFYTIYYKDKEVAFIGSKTEVERSIKLIKSEISREKKIKRNVMSLNYLIPKCDKQQILSIKSAIEDRHTKLIIYDPLPPRKNISLTLVSTYEKFDGVYKELKKKINELELFKEDFEEYQTQIYYQMTKYFFKYLQNYFQTYSTIFMKAWDSLTTDFGEDCGKYKSGFSQIKYYYIKDHELKFYMLSVIKMVKSELNENIGLKTEDVILVLKIILNNCILSDRKLCAKSYQSIFPISDSFAQFLESYNPTNYISYYSPDNISTFENKLKKKLLGNNDLMKYDRFISQMNQKRGERNDSPSYIRRKTMKRSRRIHKRSKSRDKKSHESSSISKPSSRSRSRFSSKPSRRLEQLRKQSHVKQRIKFKNDPRRSTHRYKAEKFNSSSSYSSSRGKSRSRINKSIFVDDRPKSRYKSGYPPENRYKKERRERPDSSYNSSSFSRSVYSSSSKSSTSREKDKRTYKDHRGRKRIISVSKNGHYNKFRKSKHSREPVEISSESSKSSLDSRNGEIDILFDTNKSPR